MPQDGGCLAVPFFAKSHDNRLYRLFGISEARIECTRMWSILPRPRVDDLRLGPAASVFRELISLSAKGHGQVTFFKYVWNGSKLAGSSHLAKCIGYCIYLNYKSTNDQWLSADIW